MDIQQRIEAALKTKEPKRIKARLFALGFFNKCGKCDGKGVIDGFGHIANGVCFSCGGSKGRVARMTRELVLELEAKVATGALEAYLAHNKAVAEAKRAIAPLKLTIDKEWQYGAVHTAFSKKRDIDQTSALFLAATRINKLRDVANEKAQSGKSTAAEAVEVLTQTLAAIRAENDGFTS